MAKKEEYVPGSYRIGDRLGYYENGQYRTHQAHFAKPRVPVSRRISHAWRSLNKPKEFVFNASRGIKVILFLSILISGIFLADQALRKPLLVYANPYPTMDRQVLWEDSTGSLNAWTCRLATADTVGLKAIILDANATASASCITKVPIDLSTVGSKHLEIVMSWSPNTNPGTYPSYWGWYLTRNATFPTEILDYDPGNDLNVALLNRHSDSGGGVEGAAVFLQRDPLQTVNTGDPGGCNTAGTLYMCSDGSASLPDSTLETSYSLLALNYTGNPGSTTGIKSESLLLVGEVGGSAENAVYPLPWFNFQAQSYYFGIYERARNPDPIGIRWEATSTTYFKIYASTVQGPQVPAPQAIDTGGFFGPIIKALISVGITIIVAIATFLGYVADVIIDALDTAGRFLGLGNLGTAIRDTFTGFVTWITNVLSVTVGQAINLGTAMGNIITTVVTSASSFFAGLTGFFAEITSLFSQFWTIVGTVFKFGSLGFKWLIMLDLIAGIMMAMKSVSEFRNWIWIQWTIGLGLLRVIVAIANGVTDLIAKIRTIGPRPAGI